ncbi:inner membrane protein alx [Salmonella enterica subsp. indica]|uniref:Inner membrane protein alx n=1 Tax=Salmonella enterica subsp. indica TaxID=59207 RepID=A0A379XK98_SALER|nr:inner membrane protein alx [Salmonella enterica subsp. indica]
MNTVGTPLLWGGFAVVVVIMLSIDLLLQGRRGAHAMSMKQAAGWSILWVTLSLLFNAAFWWYLAETQGREVADPQALAFLTGYLIEKSLAVDNVFVWLMLFSYFSVPSGSATPGAGVWGSWRDRVAYYHDFCRYLAYHPSSNGCCMCSAPSCCLPA